MTIIDFYGLPGSGKTTLAGQIVEQYESQQRPCYKMNMTRWGEGGNSSKAHKLSVSIRLLHPNITFLALLFCILLFKHKLVSKASFSHGMKCLAYLAQMSVVKKFGDEKSVYLSDNGLFQTFMSMLFGGSREVFESSLFRYTVKHVLNLQCTRSVHFVHVVSNIDTVVDRISVRKKQIRIEGLNQETMRKELDYQHGLLFTLDKIMSENDSVKFSLHDGTTSANFNFDE